MFCAAVRYKNGTCKISEMVKQKIVGIFLFLSSTLHAFGNLLRFPPPSPPSTTTFIFNDDYWMVVYESKMNDNFYSLHSPRLLYWFPNSSARHIWKTFSLTWYLMHGNINCYEALGITFVIPILYPFQHWAEYHFTHLSVLKLVKLAYPS